MGSKLRVGVIGTGFGAKVVAPAFSSVEGCEVVDVVTARDAAAVAALCGRTDIDLISVHSPPFMHLDHVRQAVAAGHDVLCDKPFGRNVDEAVEMRMLANEAGVLGFVNFENRFDVTRLALRRAIDDGVIGTPEHVRITALMSLWRSPLRAYGWLNDATLGGGWMRAMGSHQIDFVRWFFGTVVDSSGHLRLAVNQRPIAHGESKLCTADDGFVVSMRTTSNVTAVVDSTACAPIMSPMTVSIGGSAGMLEEGGGRITAHTPNGEAEVFRNEAPGSPLANAQAVFCEAVRDAVRSRNVPADAATFDDGVACNVVMASLDATRS